MKYTSILAGVLGLMALAACNDEVAVVEQPNVVRTLTVTWGSGADTRLTLSDYNSTDGIKSSWTAGDKIIVMPASVEDTSTFTFEAAGSGQTAVFNLVGDSGPTVGSQYVVYYPSTILNGLDISSQTGLLKDQQNYITAKVDQLTLTDDGLNSDVIMQPEESYLYIPSGTVFPGLNNFDGEFSRATITVSGTNIVTGANSEGIVFGNITIDAGTRELFVETFHDVQTAVDIYISLAVAEEKPITSLSLMVNIPNYSGDTNVEYNLIKATDSSPASIPESGHVYKIISSNLQLVTV